MAMLRRCVVPLRCRVAPAWSGIEDGGGHQRGSHHGRFVRACEVQTFRRSEIRCSHAGGDPYLRAAKRVARSMEPRYIHSGEAARRIGTQPRVLGRITGNVWVTVGGRSECVRGRARACERGRGGLVVHIASLITGTVWITVICQRCLRACVLGC